MKREKRTRRGREEDEKSSKQAEAGQKREGEKNWQCVPCGVVVEAWVGTKVVASCGLQVT